MCRTSDRISKRPIVTTTRTVLGGTNEMSSVENDMAVMLLEQVAKCELKHDENGHAYLEVPCRSIFDLGAVIVDFLQAQKPSSLSKEPQ